MRVVSSRIRLLLLATLVVFGGLLLRAAWIATVRAAPLAAMATAQTKATVPLPAGRGAIFDAVGTPLALGEQATTIYVDPSAGSDPRAPSLTGSRLPPPQRSAVLTVLHNHLNQLAHRAA